MNLAIVVVALVVLVLIGCALVLIGYVDATIDPIDPNDTGEA